MIQFASAAIPSTKSRRMPWRANIWLPLISRRRRCCLLRWSMMGDNLFSHEEEDNTVLMRVAEPSVGKKSVVKDNLVKWGALSLLLFPLVIGRAAGLLRQEKTFDTTSSPHIGLSNFIGHVVVKGWDRQQVHVLYGTTSPQVMVDVDQLPPQGPAQKIHI